LALWGVLSSGSQAHLYMPAAGSKKTENPKKTRQYINLALCQVHCRPNRYQAAAQFRSGGLKTPEP
jgi:hypothetical protein